MTKEKVSVRGRWHIEVADRLGNIKESFWKDNLVVDEGLDALLDATFNGTDNPNLVTNGTFDSDASSWTASTATVAYNAGPVSGRSNVLQVDTAAGYAWQGITTVVGQVYRISFSFYSSGTGNGQVEVGTSHGAATNLDSGSLTDTSWTDYDLYFVATATTSYISLNCSDANAQYYDSVAVYDVTGKQWFVMPVSNSASPTPSASHDYADIVAATISEFTNYTETQRQPYDVDASSSQTVDNGDPTDQRAEMTIDTGGGTIDGVCLVSKPTKSDAGSGLLFSYSEFTSGVAVSATDTFKARIVVSIS